MVNKKIIAALLSVLLAVAMIAGCAAPAELPDLAGKYTPEEDEKEPVSTESPAAATQAPAESEAPNAYEEFEKLLQKTISPAELIAFLKAGARVMSAEEARSAANTLLLRIKGFYAAQTDRFNDLQSESDDLYDLTEVSYSAANRVENESIAADEAKYLNDLIENGLMFYFAEGLVLDIDAAAFLSLFDKNAQGEAVDYMRMLLAEQEQPSMLEGMAEIGEKEMVARCEQTMKYLERYDDSPFRADMEALRLSYYRIVFVQHYALFDFDTGKAVAESRAQLERYAAAAKGTLLEPALTEFVALLEKEGWKNTKAVQQFLIDFGFTSEEVSYA